MQPFCELRCLYVRCQSPGFGKQLSKYYIALVCIPQGTTYSFRIRPDYRLTCLEAYIITLQNGRTVAESDERRGCVLRACVTIELTQTVAMITASPTIVITRAGRPASRQAKPASQAGQAPIRGYISIWLRKGIHYVLWLLYIVV